MAVQLCSPGHLPSVLCALPALRYIRSILEPGDAGDVPREGLQKKLGAEKRRLSRRFLPGQPAGAERAGIQSLSISPSAGSGLEALLPEIADRPRDVFSCGLSDRAEAGARVSRTRAARPFPPGRVFHQHDRAPRGYPGDISSSSAGTQNPAAAVAEICLINLAACLRYARGSVLSGVGTEPRPSGNGKP